MSSELLDSLTRGLVPKRIGIEEFVESSDFCGKPLYPRQTVLLKLMFLEEMTGPEEDILTEWTNGGRYNEILLSPNIRERRDYLRENKYKHFREVNLVGGRRSSKGFTTGDAMAYVMHETLQLGNPHEVYGIDPGKEIYFSCVAASESQAKEFQYSDFVSTVEGCKAFDQYLQRSLETEFRVATPADLRAISAAKARGGKIQRDIAKLRGKALAANAGTLRGSATMVITIDEMAHMTVGESKASAEAVYIAAVPSLNQFSIDGMMFLNSSPYTKVGKFYEIFEIGMRPFTGQAQYAAPGQESDQSDPRMFAFEFPSWALFEGYRKHTSRWKKRERGKEFGKMITPSPDWDPDELDADGDPLYSADDKLGIQSQRTEEAKNPEAFKVEQRGKFAEVIDAFLNPTMVDRMYTGIPAGADIGDDGQPTARFTPIFTNHGSAMPQFRYKFHVDPSSTTAGFGFAIAHIEYFRDTVTGEEVEHAVFDLIKRWDPRAFGGVIRWTPILQEIFTYASIFRPFEITMDQHQSLEPIQRLQEMLGTRNIVCQVYEKTAPQPLDAKVLTPYGWTAMGCLTLGTPVIGSDGRAHRVVGVYPKGEREVYRVVFSDGASTECTLDHLWGVQRRGHNNEWRDQTLTLREILDIGIMYPSGPLRWRIPHVAPVEYAPAVQQSLPIAPYLLGSLLGDGCFHKSVWMSAARGDADEQERLLGPLLPEGMTITRREHRPDVTKEGWTTLYFKKPEGTYRNPLSTALRELDLWCVHGRDKFIPERYFVAPIEDRVALLQGLMDTDGSVGRDQYSATFTTTSERLARGVVQLVGSLGGSAQIRTQKGRTTLTVAIKRLPEGVVPVRLTRKVARYPVTQRSGSHRHIKSVELVAVKETQCIRVEAEDHLYVTDDFILTHNTNELNWKRWEVLKTAIYQGLVHAPCDEDLNLSPWGGSGFTSKEELKFLQEIKTGGKFPKVEKQDIGPVRTKDMADCVVECTHALIGNLMATRMRARLGHSSVFGGQGGYGIGQGSAIGGVGPPGISGYYSTRDEKMAAAGMDRSSLTRSALGSRGRYRASRSRGR